MEKLREYLRTLSVDEQSDFAKRCGTSIGYIRKGLSKKQKFGVSLVIRFEQESSGLVPCEDTLPSVDWAYLRRRSRAKAMSLTA